MAEQPGKRQERKARAGEMLRRRLRIWSRRSSRTGWSGGVLNILKRTLCLVGRCILGTLEFLFKANEVLPGFPLVLLAAVVLLFWPSGFSRMLSPSTAEVSRPQRNTEQRIGRAKAELEKIKEARTKDGKPGKLSVSDWDNPEVVLPVALALVDDEFAKYGIDPVKLTREIKAAPEKFRQAVPEHRRRRFLLLTPALETSNGEQEEKRLSAVWKVYRDKNAQARVEAIAAKLVAQLPVKPPVKLFLVKDDTVNACCLPNGTIFVYSGLLERVRSDDELAFVLAHEYAHFAARHGNESFTKAVFATAGDVLAEDKGNKMKQEGKVWRSLFLRIGYLGGSWVGFQLPYSRRMETEADTLALRYMARAGYDPRAALSLWRRVEGDRKTSWTRYLSTHPEGKKRIADLEKECSRIGRAGAAPVPDHDREQTASSAAEKENVKIVVKQKKFKPSLYGEADLIEIWEGGKKVFSLQTHHRASVMLFDREKSGDHRRATAEFLEDSDDFRKYLADLKGDGDKRHLIIVDWHGGNSAFGYEGYLLDAKDHFACLGNVPAGEVCDYPAKNPDLEFVYSEEAAYFGASGSASLVLPMRVVKGKTVPVLRKAETFDLLPYSKALRSKDHTDEREFRRMTFICLYADLASQGLLKKGPELARQLGYRADEIERYQKEAMQAISRCRLWKYLKKIND